MKKVIISVLVIFGIIFSFVGYRVLVALSFFNQTKAMKSTEYKGIGTIRYDDNNFPKYLKSFCPNKNNIENVDKIRDSFPTKNNLYDSEANNKFALTAETMFSKDIDKFKSIIPIIKSRMKENKQNIPPSIKESESLPANPTFKLMRQTARYWYSISRILEHKKDYETSLYTSLALFYLSKDYQTNYALGGSLISKSICITLTNIACDSFLVWASKPKPQCKEVSKEVAKDILDFVKNEYPYSRNIDFERFMFDDMISFYEKNGSEIYARLRKSSDYKYLIDLLYNEPMKKYDKPIYEIKKEMKELFEQHNKLLCPKTSDYVYYFFFKPERLLSITLLSLACPSFETTKKAYEVNLAKMEMAAIALAINSYVCEKRKYPDSMEELSKWFGSELPNNRLTNEPYELDFKGEHAVYNENFDEFKNKKDEFYFNFSLK